MTHLGSSWARGWLVAVSLVPPAAVSAQSLVPDSFFEGRPAFSRAEEIGRPARCDELAGQLPDKVPGDSRVDLAVTGPITLLQTDGTVWYVAVCSDPGIRVLCVTYDASALHLGEPIVLRGGYSRQNARHILLDPCLTAPE